MIGSVFLAAVIVVTSPALLATLLGAALAAGYGIGRWRPWDRLDTWVWRRVMFGGTWAESRAQTYLTFWVHALVRPRITWRSWRRRHEPPTPRSPAIPVRAARPDDET